MSEAKACPFCGEQILAVAIKCKHCGSDLSGSVSGSVKKQLGMRPAFKVLLLVVLLVVGSAFVFNWSQTGTLTGKGFSDEDVANAEKSIREEFGKRPGVQVTEVKMLRESPTKLNGFVKFRVPLVGEMEKRCSASMSDNGQYIWQCD